MYSPGHAGPQGSSAPTPLTAVFARWNLAGPICVHLRRRDYAHLGTRLSLRLADAAQELAVDSGDFGVVGRRHWGQFGGVQRGGRAIVAFASLSAGGAAGGGMAAFSRDRNIPRLAFAGAVHRHPEREPLV